MKVYDSFGRLKVNAGTVATYFSDTPNLDAFGRLRISSPVGLFDSQFQYDTAPLLWETITVNGGAAAHNALGYVDLTTTGTSKDTVTRQSRQYVRYQPGRSQLVLCSFMAAGLANTSAAELGLGDASDGVFLQIVGNPDLNTPLVSLIIRAGGSDVETAASTAWNIDKMDGTGPSGITVSWALPQILWIDLELGVGRVRCGLCIDGVLYPVHEFLHANTNYGRVTYMTTANLPIRYYLTDDSGAAATLSQVCCAVFSEGGFETDRGYPFSFGNSTTGISVTTRRAVLSIRPKATFNSIVNRGTIIPEGFDLTTSSAAAQTVYWELIYDPTYTTGGGALTWTSADANSIVEYSIHADANAGAFTGGTRILSGFLPSANTGRVPSTKEVLSRLPLVLDSTGANPKALALVCTATGATTCFGALNWRELR